MNGFRIRLESDVNRARILVADNHSRSLSLSKVLLEEHYDLVGRVGDGLALLAAAQDLKPDVVISGIAMPLIGGVAVCRRLSQILPATRVVLLTAQDDPTGFKSAMRAGASGYLLRPCLPVELREAIEEVLRGGIYVTPLLRGTPVAGQNGSLPGAGPGIGTISSWPDDDACGSPAVANSARKRS